MRSYSQIKSKKSNMAGQKRVLLDLSLGKRVKLKSPLMHHGKFYHLSKFAKSFHKYLLSQLELGPSTPAKAQEKPSSTFLKEQAIENCPPFFDLLHNSLIPHKQDGGPSRS
jgi:hypothetical protein